MVYGLGLIISLFLCPPYDVLRTLRAEQSNKELEEGTTGHFKIGSSKTGPGSRCVSGTAAGRN